ncbi:MAG: amidase, partial [Planctomycetes bacterium]|nr:amidase [Planctomycetota bacterium]
PYKDRVPDDDAVVVKRLDKAGAVLVAKTTLGALAYGDIWFDGRTNNPWNLEKGSSGSSAGSAAGTAAGLFGFSLGTETLGSIVSPCMRCGATGLRPTFGRVARTGAMALCWSLDKIGAIGRTVEDCALVLDAIRGADPGDPSSIDMPYEFDATRSITGMRVGYSPKWFEGDRVNELDRAALDVARRLGIELVEIDLPDWPYGSLMTILSVEAAAAFEELTLSNRDDELVWQDARAWPNSFRQTRFTPAIEFVQAQRFRRQVMEMMDEKFADIDAMIGPTYAASLLLITNNTGHPSLTIRCGFNDNGSPHGITLLGRLFDEGTLCSLGMAMEKQLGVWDKRPVIA